MGEGSRIIKTVLVSLKGLYDKALSDNRVDTLLRSLQEFRCSIDKDIEDFLHDKAINFINRRWCSVYLLLDETSFKNGVVKVEAYFTLSHKAMNVTDNISKSKVQKISGAKQSEALHFVLIGQLGKYVDAEIKSSVDRNDILNEVYGIVYMTSEHIPCRCALVECSDAVKEKGIYESCGFKYLQHDGEHHQYYKIL